MHKVIANKKNPKRARDQAGQIRWVDIVHPFQEIREDCDRVPQRV